MKKIVVILTLLLVSTFSVWAQSSPEGNTSRDPNYVYTVSDQAVVPPSYPGGERAMYGFLAQRARYPRKAVKHQTTGKVVVSVIVEKDGTLTNPVIISDIGDGCGESVIKAVKRMPRWNSATLNRIPVRYKVRIPVTFRL